ncbi:MAG: DUF2812 domain-containing protein [Oscillospiraceae bacterium]|nr:DUF2812 domain-containing protein [Oscillospiraceae bacterium]
MKKLNKNGRNVPVVCSDVAGIALAYKRRRRVLTYKLLTYIAVSAGALAMLMMLGNLWMNLLAGALLGGAGVLALVYAVEWFTFVTAGSGRHVYMFGNGLAFSEEKDMQFCEELAAEGYALVAVNGFGYYKFKRTQPEAWSFSVDYSDVAPAGDGFADYIAIFQSGGWEYICSCDTIHWFRAPVGTTPIYTDNTSLAQKYEKLRRHSVWSAVTGLAVAVVSFVLLWIFFSSASLPVAILLGVLLGAGIGIALVMGWGIVLNHRRVLRLKKRATI